jgi:hypothetical protein
MLRSNAHASKNGGRGGPSYWTERILKRTNVREGGLLHMYLRLTLGAGAFAGGTAGVCHAVCLSYKLEPHNAFVAIISLVGCGFVTVPIEAALGACAMPLAPLWLPFMIFAR